MSFFKITGYNAPAKGGLEVSLETPDGRKAVATVSVEVMTGGVARAVPAVLGAIGQAIADLDPPAPAPPPVVKDKGAWFEPGEIPGASGHGE